jgi:hypothetical protein
MRLSLGLAGLAAVMALGSVARAAPIEGGLTAREVADVLQAKGYKAEVTPDDTGDLKVKSAADQTNFTIFFYGCNHTRRCTSVTFQAGFHVDGGVPLEKVNAWNRDKRFLKTWLDKVNDPYIEMDVDAEHGFSSEALAENIDTWVSGLPEFKTYLGF